MASQTLVASLTLVASQTLVSYLEVIVMEHQWLALLHMVELNCLLQLQSKHIEHLHP
jgi:hypothetical protein